MLPNYNYILIKVLLTVVSVTPEEFVEPDEVGAAAEVWALADEHLLDQGEVVDDDAWDGAKSEAEDVAVDLGEGGERDEGVGMFSEEMEVAEDRPGGGTGRREVLRGDRQREVRHHPLPAGRQQDQQAEQTREQQQCADRGGHGDRHDHDWRRAQVQVPQISSHAPSPPPPPPPAEPPSRFADCRPGWWWGGSLQATGDTPVPRRRGKYSFIPLGRLLSHHVLDVVNWGPQGSLRITDSISCTAILCLFSYLDE